VIAMLGDAATGWLVGSSLALLGYFVLVNGFHTVLLASAALSLHHYRRHAWGEDHRRLLGSEVAPPISVLAPAYNEERTIVESVRALLALRYPRLEVVVVNDGSTDGTLAALSDALELVPIHPIFRRRLATAPVRGLYRSRLHPELVVVDKDNGGKADALNAALNVASGELVCAQDADTLVEADGLLRMVRPFVADPRGAAAGGTIRVANAAEVRHGRIVEAHVPRRWLTGIQSVEYLRAFLFGRLGWNRLGGNLIISGAFGLFRRDYLLAIRGYGAGTVSEDMDLVVTLCDYAQQYCPSGHAAQHRLHWSVKDPSRRWVPDWLVLGTYRQVRDDLGGRIRDLLMAVQALATR
jgi:cellulose synthase/poly-beta-1,6-N-acetylglucosamine synthase-like glycosyltransferase